MPFQRPGLGGPLRVVDHVIHLVATAAPLERLERQHLAQRPQLRPGPPRLCQVRVVERVLGAVVAPDVALAAQPARIPRAAVEVGRLRDRLTRHRRRTLVRERDRQRHQRPVEIESVRRIAKSQHLGGLIVGRVRERELLNPHPPLDAVVVLLEVRASHRPVLVPAALAILDHEPPLVLAQEHVGVDQRAAAEPARAHRVDPG